MKQIKSHVYESLAPEQRVIAAIEALSRDDEAELVRLKNACPKYTYKISDPVYSEAMLHLMASAVAIQSDMKNAIIVGLLAHLANHDDGFLVGLQKLSNVDQLWTKYLESKGIARHAMDKVTKDLTPEYIPIFLKYCPAPDMNTVNEMFEEWKNYL